MQNTLITIMYRDASNCKFHGEFVVEGSLKRTALAEYLFDGEYFVPHEVGLRHLLNMPLNKDDHYLHTFEDFEPHQIGPPICTAEEFTAKIIEASKKGWLSSL